MEICQVISSRQNNLIKQYKKSDDYIKVEGVKLIHEALSAGLKPVMVFSTLKAAKKYSDLFTRLKAVVINEDLSEYISDTKAPQGFFAKFERPQPNLSLLDTANTVCLSDGIQDPGNIGAIVRSCEAFGIDTVILSSNSADVYSPKVIRSSAGSVFRVQTIRCTLTETIPMLKQAGFTVWGAALDENAVSLREAVFTPKSAVVIGNEGQGISKEVSDLCDYKLYIPIKDAESLNAGVAAGIILYQLTVDN